MCKSIAVLYTAVSTKVVQKKHKSICGNAERWSVKYSIIVLINRLKLRSHFVSFNTRKQVFTAAPSIALKTRELDDATVNNHTPIMPFGVVAYAFMLFSWTTFLETAVYETSQSCYVISYLLVRSKYLHVQATC